MTFQSISMASDCRPLPVRFTHKKCVGTLLKTGGVWRQRGQLVIDDWLRYTSEQASNSSTNSDSACLLCRVNARSIIIWCQLKLPLQIREGTLTWIREPPAVYDTALIFNAHITSLAIGSQAGSASWKQNKMWTMPHYRPVLLPPQAKLRKSISISSAQ